MIGGMTMSEKDEAIGRLVRLLDRCDTASVVRLADEVEDTVEIGCYGVYSLPEDPPHPIGANSATFQAACEGLGAWL